MVTILAGTTVLGFVLNRGPAGYEAFDRDERSLGVYPNQRKAAAALSKATKGGVP